MLGQAPWEIHYCWLHSCLHRLLLNVVKQSDATSQEHFLSSSFEAVILEMFSHFHFLLYQFTELKNTVECNCSMLICWECTAYVLWRITISLCPMSYVVLIDILKVLLDHLDKPYSDCLVNLRDQEHVDAYQEIHGTNYSMRVMSTQNYCNCNQI